MAIDGISNAVIVLVPGAWHTAQHYQSFTDLLELKGYEVIARQTPSCGSANPFEQDVERDVAAIREDLLLPPINAGRDVVLVMHSYGGCPGPAAAFGLSKAERLKAGKRGGIIGLAFISAFVVNEGASLLSMLPGNTFGAWHELFDDGQVAPIHPKEIFYADVPSPHDEQAIDRLQLQSQISFTSASPTPAWPQAVYDGRRSYLHCLEDQAIPLALQRSMLDNSGVKWNTAQMQSSHSPFLSHAQETADWLDHQAKAFVAVE